MRKELQHFHDCIVVEPNIYLGLTYEKITRILAHLMFLKLNNDGVMIKGRVCTYGIKHRDWLYKEDTTFTTVYTEGLMMSCMIDVMEGQDVATADIQGSFLQNDY